MALRLPFWKLRCRAQEEGNPRPAGPQPKFGLVLPHSDPSRLHKNVLSFCFPDLDHLARSPFYYEHTADEYTFTLTPKDEPRVHGYCRRYRTPHTWLGSRLDLSPYSASDVRQRLLHRYSSASAYFRRGAVDRFQ